MKKIPRILLAFAFCLMMLQPAAGLAAEDGPAVTVPRTEIPVDQTTGAFSFTVEIESLESYAGAEFGIICSQGTQITSVSSTGGTVTGPQAANGLVWFGFFDGADSFTGTTTVTVEGTCEIGTEGAVVLRDVSVYTIGEQEYITTDVPCGTVVNLHSGPVETEASAADPGETPEQLDMNVLMLLICLLVIAAAVAGTLIYIRYKHTTIQKENNHASE